MSHESHRHRFVLTPAEHPYYCRGCDQLGDGSSYRCQESECNLFYHEQCHNLLPLVKHPFSTKCVFQFYFFNRSGKQDLCDVCGKNIKGYHYRCKCDYIKRYAHPSCLISNQPTLEAIDGLILNLKKTATKKCLRCERRDICSKVSGWAYVSSCGDYCYHVSCVMEIVNENRKRGFITGKSDPFQIIKERFPADKDKMHQLVSCRRMDERITKKVVTLLRMLFHVFTGNPMGLVGDAKYYFGKARGNALPKPLNPCHAII